MTCSAQMQNTGDRVTLLVTALLEEPSPEFTGRAILLAEYRAGRTPGASVLEHHVASQVFATRRRNGRSAHRVVATCSKVCR